MRDDHNTTVFYSCGMVEDRNRFKTLEGSVLCNATRDSTFPATSKPSPTQLAHAPVIANGSCILAARVSHLCTNDASLCWHVETDIWHYASNSCTTLGRMIIYCGQEMMMLS